MSESPQPLHMSLEELRRHGYAAVDWVVDYLARLESLPVAARTAPGEVAALLPDDAPEDGEPFEAILADLDRAVVPHLTHWQSPSFYGYFPANSSPPSVLAELISAGLGVQGMSWATSPACTEIETRVLDWLARAMDLPVRFTSASTGGGVIQDSASSAVLCAVVAARHRAAAPIDRLVAYASQHAHSSVEKALRIAGVPAERLRLIDADTEHAMRPDALADAMRADAQAGLVPFFVAATVGTTSSLAIDPVRAIAAVAAPHGAWLHVDAAMAGVAALCPEHRALLDGVELADSVCTNPHKWLLVNFDCDAFWVADRHALIDALSILPEYLRTAAGDAGAVIDYRDWQIPLGRRFRALKLWFTMRSYGLRGLRAHLRHTIGLAGELAEKVRADESYELAAPPRLNLVCVRHRDGNDATRRVLEAVNRSGAAFVSHTVLDDRYVLRVAIGSPWTQRRHVDALWQLLQDLRDPASV